MNKSFRPRKGLFILYLAPGTILYIFTVIVPIFVAGYYGLFNWKGGKKKTFIGMENYLNIFKDRNFWGAFKNNITLVVVCLIGQIGIALIFSILLNSRYIRFKKFHRTMSYFPCVLSAVVVGFVWSMIYDYNYGLLNQTLFLLGLDNLTQVWLNNIDWVMFFVCIPLVWQYIGMYMIIILSSYATIDSQIFEMAEIDGASGIKKAAYITLPMLKNTLLVCVILCVSGNMKAFDHIYTLTGGGPGTSTNVIALYAYNTSFVRYKMGYGNAMSIVILLLSLILIGGVRTGMNRLTREKEA